MSTLLDLQTSGAPQQTGRTCDWVYLRLKVELMRKLERENNII